MNIYDYIDSPHKAVKKGYNPCYLTKVSAVVSRALSPKEWRKHLPAISFDDSVKDFSVSVFLAFFYGCYRNIDPSHMLDYRSIHAGR
ncbi:hypothetical protein JNO12_12740 [Erwinia aphidicola]|nr:hypothetical protein [Erwinia aphidicola]